jgi:hypothetical protein
VEDDLTHHRLIGELAAALGTAGADRKRLRLATAVLRDDLTSVVALLDDLTSDPGRAATVARSSYWHSNGFAKLVLHRNTDPELSLRLHVWTGDRPAPTVDYQNIHNHRWAFGSVVLAGALDVDEFEETSDAADPKALACNAYAYDAVADGASGQLRPLGIRALRPTGSASYEAGEMHLCDTRTLHTVTPVGSGLTATILVQGPAETGTALVYQQTGRAVIEDTGERLGPGDVSDLAAATLAVMAPAATRAGG